MTGRPIRHGMTHTPIHRAWSGMMNRCRDKHPRNHYIERGINVCNEWKSFEKFFEDMNGSFKKGLTLERIDNTKGYSKKNCRWATMREQAQNRSSSLFLDFEGSKYTLGQLSMKYSLPYLLLYQRVKKRGWSIKKAVETPTMSPQQSGKKSSESINHINNKRSLARIKSKTQ